MKKLLFIFFLCWSVLAQQQVQKVVNTIADLKNLNPDDFNKAVLVLGALSPNDGGSSTYWWDPASTSVADNDQVVSTPRKATGRWLKISTPVGSSDYVNVKSKGARGDGVTDDTVAVQAATALANLTSKSLYFPSGTYILSGTATLTNGIRVFGDGSSSLIKQTSPATIFLMTAGFSGGSFQFLNFDSTKTGTNIPICIGANVDGLNNVSILDSHFGNVLVNILDANAFDNLPKSTNFLMSGCEFHGDYTGSVFGNSIDNVCQIGGFDGISIRDCVFNVTNPERVLHMPGSSQNLKITGNTIKSFSAIGDQCISTEGDKQVIVSDNHFVLTGSWVCFLEEKNGDGGAFFFEPNDISFTGNDCRAVSDYAHFSAVSFLGLWGLNSQTISNSIATISHNNFQVVATNSVEPVVSLKGFTSAKISGNLIDPGPDRDYLRAINVDCNRSSDVSGNIISSGSITFAGHAFNNNGVQYKFSPKQVNIIGNTINSFKQLGGIYGTSLTNTMINIVGNHVVTLWGTNNSVALYYTDADCNGLTGEIVGNYGTKPDGTVGYVSLSGWTSQNVSGNSWQTFAGTGDYLPKWGLDGYSLGNSIVKNNGNQVGIGVGAYSGPGLFNVFNGDMYFGDAAANSRVIWFQVSGTNIGGIGTFGNRLTLFGGAVGANHFMVGPTGAINFNVNGLGLYHGGGSPEGVRVADTGSIYLRETQGNNAQFYVKTAGTNTFNGWIGICATNHDAVFMGDFATPITTGTGKAVWRAPYTGKVRDVRASLLTASSSGIVTVNIKKNGSTIFLTQLTIDQSEDSSTTAATPYVFVGDTSMVEDDKYTFDIAGAGTGAVGLSVQMFHSQQ